MNTLIIEITAFDQYYSLGFGVKDREKFNQQIFETQFQYIRPLLGQEKYTELITQIKAGNVTPENEILLNGDETTFLGIAPFLVWQTLAKFFQLYGIEVERGGIKFLLDENSENIDSKTRQSLVESALRNADIYKAELERFLKLNALDEKSSTHEQKLNSFTSTATKGYYRIKGR